ncbi:L,D-transpeptidase family protein [Thiomicrorhabdus chilensis]|uniref:L,D-transpeptidase family protein n=1 Tax=Thiomicrorhabdus chilensis TaxID=63656 RepID=UPI00041DD6B3|nr:L,D-transpeptidase family protein [Thiomicrorhabdus chilensis]
MGRLLRIVMIAAMLLVSTQSQADDLSPSLKTMLDQNTFPLTEGLGVVVLSQRPYLKQFYQQRDYRPAWENDHHTEELIAQLLQSINKATKDGLDPSHSAYHKTRIQQLSDPITPENQVFRDILLSDAFMALGSHLYHGVAFKTEVDTLHRVIQPNHLNRVALLEKALQTRQITSSLSSLAPRHPRYQNLKKALHNYQKIADQGGWNEDPEAYLDPEQVKKRLLITGEFHAPTDPKPTSVNGNSVSDSVNWHWSGSITDAENNDPLTEAVKTFQRRQHITVDGIVGVQTRLKLAESVHQIIERIRLNLERWRWFNPLVEDNYVMVNIPDFSMQYINDEQRLSMNVVVGQKKRQTPMMQAKMSYLVFNPYWRIPKTILAEDILPKLRKNREYLKANQITLFSSADQTESDPLNAEDIDWNRVTPNGMLRYIFRQEPGLKNPLGSLKFMFPNSEDIYIHDTSARYHFKNKAFLVSSGCIRAEKPIQLAYELLVNDHPEVTYESLYQQIQSGQRQVIWLKEKIPVYLTYQTAWADEEGILYLRNDVYGHDAKVLNFIKQI